MTGTQGLADRSRPLNHDPNRLRRRRIASGLTGAKLARAARCSPGYLSQLENGLYSASPELLSRLAEALRCQSADLMPAEQDRTTGIAA